MSLGPLGRPVQFLKGVGPARSEALKKLRIGTARDLLYHVPRRYDDASTILPISSLSVGQDGTALGRVRSKGIIPTRSGLRIFQLVLQDETGYITCSWPGQPWLERRFRKGDLLLVAGPVRHFHGRQIHPREFSVVARSGEEVELPGAGTVFVTYPAVEGVPQWTLREIFGRNLDWLLTHVSGEEYLPPDRRRALGLVGLGEALRRLHRPGTVVEPEEGRRRLAFDELFFLQLVQALARQRQTELRPGIEFRRSNRWIRPLHASLPFELTGAQARVLGEIAADMTSRRRMNRFLQGDVGAGKTLVALFAMLLAAESGHQSALMVPTELLAEQHAAAVGQFLGRAGVDVRYVLLTGSVPVRERQDALDRLGPAGDAMIAIGTHALIQEGVEFRRLGLVIVDEQHRFGVRQRMALAGHGGPGGWPDVLVMSATPIPRSLALVLHGDLDLSVLDEVPPGRVRVETTLCRPERRSEAYARVAEELGKGRQGYFVFPLVGESDTLALRSATAEHDRLRTEVFPDRRLGLVHGQLSGEERDAAMRAFREGETDILVATSVVEVGIDVPNATFMVIEHADRFGLSQLHQLRGRVGRGRHESVCILVADPGVQASERLGVLCHTHDGFAVARADLEIRGQGDLFGARQHGRSPFLRFADLRTDETLLAEAQRLARATVAADPELTSRPNVRIRSILEECHGERLRLWKVG